MFFFTLLACIGGKTSDPVEFACGADTCDASLEYCYQVTGGIQDSEPDVPSCTPLPEACLDDPTCACLEAEGASSGGFCEELEGGGLFVELQAP